MGTQSQHEELGCHTSTGMRERYSVNIWVFVAVDQAIDKLELLEKFYVTIK